MSPSPGKTPLYEAFRQLARFGEAFQLRGSNAADLADIAREMQTGKKPQEKFTAGPSTALHRGTRKKTLALYIEGLDGEQHKLLDIFESESARPFVVIGNSEVGQDKGGSHAYQIAFAWAHNNGKTMRPDPAGLTVINRLRRSEALISSALRFGTTRHLEPHADQYIALAPTTRRLGAEPEDTHYGSNPQLHGELAALKEKLWTTGMMPLPLPTMFSILLKPLPRSRDCANPHCATSRSWTEHCATGVWKNRFLWATWRLVSKMQNESSPVSLYSQPVQAWASLLLSATQSQPLSQGPFPMDQLHRLASTRKNTVTSAVSMLRQSGPLGKRWAALMAGRLRD